MNAATALTRAATMSPDRDPKLIKAKCFSDLRQPAYRSLNTGTLNHLPRSGKAVCYIMIRLHIVIDKSRGLVLPRIGTLAIPFAGLRERDYHALR